MTLIRASKISHRERLQDRRDLSFMELSLLQRERFGGWSFFNR